MSVKKCSLGSPGVPRFSTHSMVLRRSNRRVNFDNYKSDVSQSKCLEIYYATDQEFKQSAVHSVKTVSQENNSIFIERNLNYISDTSEAYSNSSVNKSFSHLKDSNANFVNISGINSHVSDTHTCVNELVNKVCENATTLSNNYLHCYKEILNGCSPTLFSASDMTYRNSTARKSMGRHEDYAYRHMAHSYATEREGDGFSSGSSHLDDDSLPPTQYYLRNTVSRCSGNIQSSSVSTNTEQSSKHSESLSKSSSPINLYQSSAAYKYSHNDSDDSDTLMSMADSEINLVSDDSGYIMMLRKWLYFCLSKPTHWDVEILSRLSTFGKTKALFLILLPVLLYFLLSPLGSNALRYVWEYLQAGLILVVSRIANSGVIFSSSELVSHSSIPAFSQSEVLLSKRFNENLPVSNSATSQNLNMSEVRALVHQFFSQEVETIQHMREEKIEVMQDLMKLQTEFSILQATMKSLSDKMMSLEVSTNEKFLQADEGKRIHGFETELETLNKKVAKFGRTIENFFESVQSMKNCCYNSTTLPSPIDLHILTALKSVMDGSTDAKFLPFRDWLFANFAHGKRFAAELKSINETMKIRSDLAEKKFMQAIGQFTDFSSSTPGSSSLSVSDFELMIKKAILMYDADKTGQTDYALESGGGSVISTRCSETYSDRNPRITILGFPLWYGSNSPRNAIQPNVYPGQCWAFKGTHGYLVIQLAATIRPTGFVVEHISKSISPTGNINSAPKDFSVYGLKDEKESEGTLLGKYTYDQDGESLQYFPVQVEETMPYNFIELKIHSNHGDLNYTCLYRFRVHGLRV